MRLANKTAAADERNHNDGARSDENDVFGYCIDLVEL